MSQRTAHDAGPTLGEHEGRPALLIDGAVQSVLPDEAGETGGYWPVLLPADAPRRALLLGLGGGTVAALLQRRFGAVEITGVDNDPRVIELAGEAFAPALAGVETVRADARAFLKQQGSVYELIVVDLFRHGAVPDFVCSRPFLAALAAALAPGGLATFNLNRGARRVSQLRRLARRFAPERLIGTGMNLVVHARPLPRRRYRRRR